MKKYIALQTSLPSGLNFHKNELQQNDAADPVKINKNESFISNKTRSMPWTIWTDHHVDVLMIKYIQMQ